VATTHKFRKIAYSSLFGLGLTAGGVTIASAATTQQAPPTTVEAPAAAGSQDKADTGTDERNEARRKERGRREARLHQLGDHRGHPGGP
jgi:hypothetical protein